jgi:hypothetical protein
MLIAFLKKVVVTVYSYLEISDPSRIALLVELFEIYHDYLRRVVSADRLFSFSVKDGWEPLCNILNVPDQPFPHANDKEAIQETFGGLVKKATVRRLLIFAAVGVALAGGVKLLI